jgi:putative flippase GtrA
VTVLRYIAVQCAAYAIDLGTFLLVLWLWPVGAVAANVAAKLAAGLAAFVAHRNFSFVEADTGDLGRQARRYFLLLALNVPLSSACLTLVLLAASSTVGAKVVSDILCVGLTYMLSRYFVFTGRVAAPDPSMPSRRL